MRPAIALSMLLALSIAAPLAGALTDEAPPEHQDGDRWVREAEVTTQRGTFTITQTTVYAGTEEITVNGTPYDTLVMETERVTRGGSGQQSFTQWSNSTQWMTTDEHAMVKTTNNVTITGTPSGPQEFSQTTTYDEPCPSFQWPMNVGDSWTQDCNATTQQGNRSQERRQQRDFHILREETVTVPAGTFETLVISNQTKDSDEDSTTQWYAPRACGPVKLETSQGQQTFTLNLTEYTCASTAGMEGPSGPGGQGGTNGSPGPGAVIIAAALMATAVVFRRPRG